jgi:ABC-type antimicrobial peptide transport system permease subunit
LFFVVEPSFFRLEGIIPSYGDSFKEGEEGNSMVISTAGAKLFNLEPEDIMNKKVSIVLFLPKMSEEGFEEIEASKRQEEYRIVGVIEDESMGYAFIPSKSVSDLEINKYEKVKVRVKSNENMDQVRNTVIEKGFIVSSLSDTIEQANKIFRVIQIVLSLFGLVALVVSAIGMFNTMTITLLERINEIGIMRAIGITKRDIRIIFLLESVIMGFLGGILGIFVGYMGGEIANLGINLLAESFGGQALDLFYRPVWFMMFIVIFSTVIGFITGIYPSVKASKLNPLSALRYK